VVLGKPGLAAVLDREIHVQTQAAVALTGMIAVVLVSVAVWHMVVRASPGVTWDRRSSTPSLILVLQTS
jgi:hypothetical protein